MTIYDEKTVRRWKDAPEINGEMEPERVDTYLTDNYIHNVRIITPNNEPQDKVESGKAKLRPIDRERLDLILMRKQHNYYELGTIAAIEALKKLDITEEQIDTILESSSFEFDSVIAEYVNKNTDEIEELLNDG